ncbi:hypothetical protein RJ639_006908, partial [Escallonia herrerae]
GLSKSKGEAIIMSDPVGEAIGEVEVNTIFKMKERKKTSSVWDFFVDVTLANGIKKVKCKLCNAILNKTKGGTITQVLRHRDTYCPKHGVANNQSMINVELGKSAKRTFKYNHAKVREVAAQMILVHEYPFSMMEHEFFNRFMRTATPYYESISRTTAKSDVMATYEREKKSLREGNFPNLTSNFWKSGQKIGYMVLTVHFIDSDWKLQKKLNFCDVPPPYTSLVICEAITKCLDDWGIGNKVSTMTFDNATNNNAVIKYLKEDISLKRSLLFAGKIFHVRCCAHIINLMVQDGLSEVKHVIENVRESVKYINATESQIIMFSDIEKSLELPQKKLILDVATR